MNNYDDQVRYSTIMAINILEIYEYRTCFLKNGQYLSPIA